MSGGAETPRAQARSVPSEWAWNPAADATLAGIVPAVGGGEHIVVQSAPFRESPEVIAETHGRFANCSWTECGTLLVDEQGRDGIVQSKAKVAGRSSWTTSMQSYPSDTRVPNTPPAASSGGRLLREFLTGDGLPGTCLGTGRPDLHELSIDAR